MPRSFLTSLFPALALLATSSSASATTVPPGQLVPTFGVDGIRSIAFDMPGESPVDSARAILLQGGSPLNPGSGKLLVAGIAGSHIGIARLTYTTGQLDPAFGNGGKAVSTRSNVTSFAGMLLMPNGDIVIGYSDEFLGDGDSKDFFIEVFTADGQPKDVGGDEVPNQRWVDFSNGNDSFGTPCVDLYRDSAAHTLLLTTEGGIAIAGDILISNFGSPFRAAVSAEFNGGSYVPARPSPETCFSAGGNGGYSYGPMQVSAGVSISPQLVYLAGSSGAGDARYKLAELTSSSYNDYGATVSDYWSERNSAFSQVRFEQNLGSLLLLGDAESTFVGGGLKREPMIAIGSAVTVQPHWFFSAGATADESISVHDGQRIFGAGSIVVAGSAHDCTIANSCTAGNNSFVIGLSDGSIAFNAYAPDTRFGNTGWARLRVPTSAGSNSPSVEGWKLLVSGGVTFAQDTDAFLVGDFKANSLPASADRDFFVARVRLANGDDGIFVPADTIFRNGFE